MSLEDHAELLGPELFRAIERKGYADLTAVQLAVLDPALAGRDLRITSQTGSGKTLAIGLILRTLAGEESAADHGVARPRVLIVAPTRELAHQVEQELTWLYAEIGIRLATTTGGASYRDEHRALSKGPSVVVGTPGRLLDHLKRGSIEPSQVTTVVLDEADRMLDLGFRDDLEQLFKSVPKERSTHLVSATFPRMVRSLADRLQRDPAHVEGTRLGAANVDIDHVIHVVDSSQRLDALINMLLAYPEDQTLVFVRTRADAAHIANELVVTGFAASALSGEMEQAARNRALSAFREGRLRVLIATDVAARGIDVQGVTRVVHGELPTNADAYTHRSGRTGRAGRKGTSSLLVAPAGVVRASRLLRGLGIQHRFEPIPTAEEILRADDTRLFDDLTADSAARADAADASDDAAATDAAAQDQEAFERWRSLAERLVEAGNVEQTLVRLLTHARRGITAPRTVRVFPERQRREEAADSFAFKRRDREDPRRGRDRDEGRGRERFARAEPVRPRPSKRERDARGERDVPPRKAASTREAPAEIELAEDPKLLADDVAADHRPETENESEHPPAKRASDAESPRPARTPRASDEREKPSARSARGASDKGREPRGVEPRARGSRDAERATPDAGFTSFHVSWGQRDGADARRLLAMLCRRGQIRGRDVGAIRVESSYSLVQVANAVAPAFARSAARPDPREPDVIIRPDRAQPADELQATKTKLRSANPFQRDRKGKPGGQHPPKRHKPPSRGR
ncbi:MAG TPA: DEAD/DEAH box helicase [Polyangiales bacterium]|nr:DEAD/DEAH box helicase [Polyangiales bacterium]